MYSPESSSSSSYTLSPSRSNADLQSPSTSTFRDAPYNSYTSPLHSPLSSPLASPRRGRPRKGSVNISRSVRFDDGSFGSFDNARIGSRNRSSSLSSALLRQESYPDLNEEDELDSLARAVLISGISSSPSVTPQPLSPLLGPRSPTSDTLPLQRSLIYQAKNERLDYLRKNLIPPKDLGLKTFVNWIKENRDTLDMLFRTEGGSRDGHKNKFYGKIYQELY